MSRSPRSWFRQRPFNGHIAGHSGLKAKRPGLTPARRALRFEPLEERALLSVVPGTVLTGAGPGGGPHVKGFDPLNQTEIPSFFAYDAAVSLGVRVAGGDVNGDGIADVITAPGPGGGPHVRVFDGNDGSELTEFFAYDAHFSGGLFVASGDLNNDGHADIVTAPAAGGGPHVRAYSGANGSVLGEFFAYAADFAGGVTVALGDVNGDGRADIITGTGAGGGPHVRVFSGLDRSLLLEFFAYDSAFDRGIFVAAGDLNGDGRADIITGPGAGGGPHIRAFSGVDGSLLGEFFAFDPQVQVGVRVATAGADDTGSAAIITAAGPGGGPHVRVFQGLSQVIDGEFFAYDAALGGGVFVAAAPHGPRATINSSHATDTADPSIQVNFSRRMGSSIVSAANYQLTVEGGPNNGQVIAIAEVEKLPILAVVGQGDAVSLKLDAPLDDGNYLLEVGANVRDQRNTPLLPPRSFRFSVASAAAVSHTTPAHGDQAVSLTREIVVHFDKPIQAASINAQTFQVLAGGSPLPGNRRVSQSGRFATFFHDVDFPAATSIRVIVDGDKVLGADGLPLDGDVNGQPGGLFTAEFSTASLTRIPGSDVTGFVFDSQNRRSDGSNLPIVGARLIVEGIPGVSAVTDQNGFFRLIDMPAPDIFVTIDATDIPAPGNNAFYGKVRKPFHPVAGHSTQLNMNGVPFDIFLPPIPISEMVDIRQNNVVHFGPSAMQFLTTRFPHIPSQQWEKVSVTVPPNTLFHNDGRPQHEVVLVPLEMDRIPAPVPPGLNPALVFTLDAAGAENIDGVASMTYPNLDNLPAGSKTFFYAFDHDAGHWITTGTGTVSADATIITSDDGAGIRTLGWRFVAPGTMPELPKLPEEVDCEDLHFGFKEAWKLVGAAAKCVKDMTGVLGALAEAFDIFENFRKFYDSLQKTDEELNEGALSCDDLVQRLEGFKSFKEGLSKAYDLLFSVTPEQKGLDALKCAKELLKAANDILCDKEECLGAVKRFVCDRVVPLTNLVDKLSDLLEKVRKKKEEFGTEVLCALLEGFVFEVMQECASLTSSGVDVRTQALTSPKIRAALDALLVEADNFDLHLLEILDLHNTFADMRSTVTEVQRDGLVLLLFDVSGFHNSHWRFEVGSLDLRGQTNAMGNFNLPFLPPTTPYRFAIFDLEHNVLARSQGTSAGNGLNTPLGPFETLDLDGEADADADGLADLAEAIVGTRSDLADTDGDGLSDLAEVQQGLNPLDNRGFPTGVIASLALKGEAREVVVEAQDNDPAQLIAYVATGSHGLATVDVSKFSQPVVRGQLDLPGTATDVAIDPIAQRAFVAAGIAGLHIVDVALPSVPTLQATLAISGGVERVKSLGGTIYAAGSQSVHVIDADSGTTRQSLGLGSTVKDLAHDGAAIFAVTEDRRLHVISLEDEAIVTASLALPAAANKIFISGGVAYIANGLDNAFGTAGYTTVDVRNPYAPVVLSGPDTPNVQAGNLHTVVNGSGLAVIAAGTRGIELHNASDPTDTYEFLTRFETPGVAQSVSIAAGIGFVADGAAGLHVLNYRPFDQAGRPPVVAITSPATDADPTKPGIQLIEGTSIPIVLSQLTDDVQVRHVELLVNGVVAATDVSAPFGFLFDVPLIAEGTSSLSIEVRATDTGGNSALSDPLSFEVVPDTFAPAIVRLTPAEGQVVPVNLKTVTVKFSEPIDPASVTAANFQLLSPSVQVQPLQAQRSIDGRTVTLTLTGGRLSPGQYRLVLAAPQIRDLLGNPMGSAPLAMPLNAIVLLEDSFDRENNGQGLLNFANFTQWDVLDGSVDLLSRNLSNVIGGQGLYVDLDGTTNDGGRLVSKETLQLIPGTYELRFDLAGKLPDPMSTMVVRLGNVYEESFTLASNDSFRTVVRSLTITAATSGKLSFDQQGGDNQGVVLDNVKLTFTGAGTVPGDLFGRNLITNADGEAGLGAGDRMTIVQVPGWTTSGAFNVVRYGAEDFPNANSPAPPGRGLNFFAGGPANPGSRAAQVINLSAAAAAIDQHAVIFNLDGYLGGFQRQGDHARFIATFLDVEGQVLESARIGPVSDDDRQQLSALYPRSNSASVPAGTRSVELALEMTRLEGSYNDGYADNLHFSLFVILDPPLGPP